MGTDLHMNPPNAEPVQFRVLTSGPYVALYRSSARYSPRPGDHYPRYWRREYLATDNDDQLLLSGIRAALGAAAYGRYIVMERDDLCVSAADEPFPESVPWEILEIDNRLVAQRAELLRQAAELQRRIDKGETE